MACKLCLFINEVVQNQTQSNPLKETYTRVLMLISCDEKKKVVYITPGGDLVAEEAEAMQGKLQAYMRHDLETLVLDLARVRTIDSFGLKTIIEHYNLLCKGKGELIIENASQELKRLFRLMRIDGRLTISHTGWPS